MIDINELRPAVEAAGLNAISMQEVLELLDRLEEAESECLEQARLNGLGASREASLMAKLEAAEKERDNANAAASGIALQAEKLQEENDELRKALAQKVTSETMLRDLSVGNGSINASFEGGAVHLLVDSLATQFVKSGAHNYIEMQFHSEATGPLLLTLQRVNGATPHELRAKAEKERDALLTKIEAMERQEPVAWLHETRRDSDVVTDAVKHVWGKAVVGSLAAYSIPLYLAPGAQGEKK